MRARLNETTAQVTAAFERYAFGDAADALRTAFWTNFCDFYLEATKTEELAGLDETRRLLGAALHTYLRLLHPLIPFVTEDIWQRTGHEGMLIQQPWPAAEGSVEDEANRNGVDAFIRLVTLIRNWRAKGGLKWNHELDVRLHAKEHADVLNATAPLLRKLCSVRKFELVSAEPEGDVVSDDAFAVAITL
jgi:valyl-tRNA synthetase